MNKTTQEQLNIIAEHLWNGRASLLVGAGFSKNAHVLPDGHMPPDWDELGDLFLEKSRKRKIHPKDRNYANVLRLAEEVENVCGRDALTELIRNAIYDDKLEPSDLHMQLLALPWQDVFTTNYDTLLDRSSIRLKEQGRRSYSLIMNDTEIGGASYPFLMKLHGDINDPKSIIITEEDYRTYPHGHQAMINVIRTTILRNTLVLIGFSGNDPNFLQWLGWVKDVLNDKQRKVYLLTIGDFAEATQKTFEKKNVVVVDLQKLVKKGTKPSDIIATAVQCLEDYQQKRDNDRKWFWSAALDWGRSIHEQKNSRQLLECWRKERDSYPGWLVLPRDKREYWANTEGFTLSQDLLSGLKRYEDILFLDLFNWRIEKCLYPIENRWEPIYQSVIDKYQPFSKRCRSDVRDAWVNLKLGLLRLYRQEGWHEKWVSLCDELRSIKEKMNDDQRGRFDYEQALEAVYQSDFKLLKEILENWRESTSDPYWDIRRGALWAEYLSLEKGKAVTCKAFRVICEKLKASSREQERFYWASRKVHAHTVWNCMAQANFSDGEEERKAARNTWQELLPYDDIWYEREFFDAHLRPIEEVLKVQTKTTTFRLGHIRKTTNLGGNAMDYRIAYAFFMYYEETGFPIHLPYLNTVEKTTLKKALSVMEYCSHPIAECWLLRSGDSDVVPAVYNRRFLERTRFKDVDALFNRYLGYLDRLAKTEEDGESQPWMLAFKRVVPEILSRLCMKSSYQSRVAVFDCVGTLFATKETFDFSGLDNMISSIVSSFSSSEIKKLIPKLASLPVAKGRNGDCGFEPLSHVSNPEKIDTPVQSVVKELFGRLGTNQKEDKALLIRLLFLYKRGALSKRQQNQLAKKLWEKRDASGFPYETVLWHYAFLSYPHPVSIDPQLLLKEYIKKQSFPVMGKGSMVSFYGGSVPVFRELLGAAKDENFYWDESLLNHICSKIIKMWDGDKERLLENEGVLPNLSPKEELQLRFEDVERIVVKILAPCFHLLEDNNKSDLMRMAMEFEEYGMPSLRMRLALTNKKSEIKKLEKSIPRQLGSFEKQFVDDAVAAIILLYEKGHDVLRFVEMMSQYFRSNAEQGQIPVIEGLKYFIEKKEDCLDYGFVRMNLLLGLGRLFSATQISKTDSEIEANTKMNLRRLVAPIVSKLVHGSSSESDEILSVWDSYYNSTETCWDIKNEYCQ